MRKLNLLSVIGGAILFAIAAPSFAQVAGNTCSPPAVAAPHQGQHSALDTSADGVLWPPNHKFRTVGLSGSTNALGHDCKIHIDAVKQDEDPRGGGSGQTYPDAQNCQNNGTSASVDLRGERSGLCTSTSCTGTTEDSSQGSAGDGRYYHVQYTLTDPDTMMMASGMNCSDGNGGTETCEAKLLVPHDQGTAHAGTWVDEGPIFDSGATCN